MTRNLFSFNLKLILLALSPDFARLPLLQRTVQTLHTREAAISLGISAHSVLSGSLWLRTIGKTLSATSQYLYYCNTQEPQPPIKISGRNITSGEQEKSFSFDIHTFLDIAETGVHKNRGGKKEKDRASVSMPPEVWNSINDTMEKLSRASSFLHQLPSMTIQYRWFKPCFHYVQIDFLFCQSLQPLVF